LKLWSASKLAMSANKFVPMNVINMDFWSNCQCKISHNISVELPFDDKIFDVVYHLNILEQ
jgi:hypothetical protein